MSVQYASDSPSRRPFKLSAVAACGTVNVFIPRSYTGTMNIRSAIGTYYIIGDLAARTTTLQEFNGRTRCFVGDLPSETYSAWSGDELFLEAKIGTVTVQYV